MTPYTVLTTSALLLAGCKQGGAVDISGTAGNLRFAAISQEGARPLCADKLSITPAARQDADPVWQITAADPAKCTVALRYGQPTADFAEQVRVTPLRPGIVYRVRISGAGFSAVQDFHLTDQGVPQNDS